METIIVGTTEVVVLQNKYFRKGYTKRDGVVYELGKLIQCVYCNKPKYLSTTQRIAGVGIMHRICKNIANGIRRREDLMTSKKTIVNCIVSSYKGGAKERKIAFTLTSEEVEQLIFNNCSYCGSKPKLLYYDRIDLPYNGLDRVNNKLGYTKKNCVTCCIMCNRAKHTLSLEEFTIWLNQLATFITNKN